MYPVDLYMISSWISGLVPPTAIALLLIAAYMDIRKRRIPNWISLLLLAGFGFIAFMDVSRIDFFIHLMWGGITLTCLLPLYAWGKIGGGDVKLLSVLTVWAGPISGLKFLFLTTVFGGGLALVVLSPFLRNFWDWAQANVGFQDNVLIFPTRNSLPYAVAISFAGSFMIFDVFMV